MKQLIQRAEHIARKAQERRMAAFARTLSKHMAEEAIEFGEGRVVVRGRNLMRRWLAEPALRFVAGETR